jgi:hypothetical protein
VPEFHQKYFENPEWASAATNIVLDCMSANPVESFKLSDDKSFVAWLNNVLRPYTPSLLRQVLTSTTKSVSGMAHPRQMDVIFKAKNLPSDRHHIAEITVIGELTTSKRQGVWQSKFLQLSTYVRELFIARPQRLFAHGFIIFHDEMQPWVFDRSGAFASDAFNIYQQPSRFLTTLVGYCLMSDEDTGVVDFELPFPRKNDFLFKSHAIISRGTSVQATTDDKMVAKFSWQRDVHPTEAELLRSASHVIGMPQLAHYQQLATIEDLRAGLTFSPSTRRFITGDVQSQKKKRNISQVQTDEEEDTARPADLTHPENSFFFENKTFWCLFITPRGRSIDHFRELGVKQILMGFRDAIDLHQRLVTEAKILHRDVSIGNIAVTEPTINSGKCGMLIDLDHAARIDENGLTINTGARTMPGTYEYMALEIIEGEGEVSHTFRHDVESFFWVLLSIGLLDGREKGDDKPIQKWYRGGYFDVFDAKVSELTKLGRPKTSFSARFEQIRPLLRQLKNILFYPAGTNNEVFLGAHSHADALYKDVIDALTDAIVNCEEKVVPKTRDKSYDCASTTILKRSHCLRAKSTVDGLDRD